MIIEIKSNDTTFIFNDSLKWEQQASETLNYVSDNAEEIPSDTCTLYKLEETTISIFNNRYFAITQNNIE
ncbi:hypothetical protein [Dysgonomonas macrotermitis]|uniref:Uncharacterized protein n=1 Tax=Dysgonomonas macrotermitis TaxID=1346286 RepID=A0A1M5HBI9_9BACT|nr:hypothetical protein [Dysgonomonas macrotermitis]SHG13350.1 hypothetical protein SAMN05444362_11613 [Dysgonomonas macrotermitis]